MLPEIRLFWFVRIYENPAVLSNPGASGDVDVKIWTCAEAADKRGRGTKLFFS